MDTNTLARLLIDIESNRRLDTRHMRMDLPSGSSGIGEGPPSTGPKQCEPLLLAYYQNHNMNEMEVAAEFLLAKIPSRQLLAVLIKHLKEDRRRSGIWAQKYSDIRAEIGFYARTLGFEVGCGRCLGFEFETDASIKSCAGRGERNILHMIEQMSEALI